MSTAVGQIITHVITIRDNSNVSITDLLEDDFSTLEAYLVTTPATTAIVTLDEIDDGQYALSFVPSASGPWALHYVYNDTPVFREDTLVYEVESTAEIVVITGGGIWTYTGDLTDPTQEVRFNIQDVDGDHPLFTDTEIAYALGAANGRVRRASASLVERLMVRYAQMADTTELDLSVRASQLYEHYRELYLKLTSPFSGENGAVPYAGGISYSDIAGNRANTDRVRSIFDSTSIVNRRDWGGIR
jgi:hypothetical protein